MATFPAHTSSVDLADLAHKYDMGENEADDLALFAATGIPAESAKPSEVATQFKDWWGGTVPAYWSKVTPPDLKKLTSGAQDLDFHIALHDGDAHAVSGNTKSASLMFAAICATALSRQQGRGHDSGSNLRDFFAARDERASKEDAAWTDSDPGTISIYSCTEGSTKHLNTEGEVEDSMYADHVWASEQRGVKPLARKAWSSLKGTAKTAARKYDTETYTAVLIHKVTNNKEPLGQYVHDHVDEKLKAYTKNLKESDALKHIETQQSALRDVNRRKSSDPASKGLAESKAEGEGNRSYQDYLAEKKSKGGKPMEKETWEARFKKGSDLRAGTIRLAYSSSSALRGALLRLLD